MVNYLRTPDEAFNHLPAYPFAPHYVEINGGRLHYIDEGRGEVILCLHGEPSWSYLYRKLFPVLSPNYRVIAPDFFGFGKSDKPVAEDDCTYQFHFDTLGAFVEMLDLKDITLVVQDWGGLIGLPWAAKNPGRIKRLVIMNTGLPSGKGVASLKEFIKGFAFFMWRRASAGLMKKPVGVTIQMGCKTKLPADVKNAYSAPFPDNSYKAAARKFPYLVPTRPRDEATPFMQMARKELSTWNKPVQIIFSDGDPITGHLDKFFHRLIPSAAQNPIIKITGAGHFLQEDKGEEIAAHIAQFMAKYP
jgi:haloalkane dehalogenase